MCFLIMLASRRSAANTKRPIHSDASCARPCMLFASLHATAEAKRPSKATLASCPSTSPVTGRPASPQIVPKRQTRWTSFDDKILSLCARGMTVREIQAHLQEMYGAEVSPTLISSVTDAVMDEAKAWQARPLEGCTRSLIWTAHRTPQPELCELEDAQSGGR